MAYSNVTRSLAVRMVRKPVYSPLADEGHSDAYPPLSAQPTIRTCIVLLILGYALLPK